LPTDQEQNDQADRQHDYFHFATHCLPASNKYSICGAISSAFMAWLFSQWIGEETNCGTSLPFRLIVRLPNAVAIRHQDHLTRHFPIC
jgi:hypothetical protein